MKTIPKIAQTAGSFVQEPHPASLDSIPADCRVELDVREELRAGREPFSLIMGAIGEVKDGGALVLRATFEPVPLYTVLSRRGFAHWTEKLADDDWRVWFYRPDVVVLDVRDLDPPEPMTRTLEALESLAPSHTLIQINVRVPMFLLPVLEERGFTYQVDEQQAGVVRVSIKHGKES
jgi:uncharacterized protein (DUF2249 family)